MISTSEQSNSSGFTDSDKIAILSLRPKQLLMNYVRDIAKRTLNEPSSMTDKMLDNNYLEAHSVPVCTNRYQSSAELEDFLQNNSDVLANLMLSSWMWPINKWGFDANNQNTIQSLMAVEYRPFVYMASQNTQNPTKLAVTYASPTRDLAEDLARQVANTADNEALEELRFKVRYGIAIISDNISCEQYSNPVDYCGALANPLSYLKSLSDSEARKLLLFYYGSEEKLPDPVNIGDINKWFSFSSNQGLYMLTKPWMATRYRRVSSRGSDSGFY